MTWFSLFRAARFLAGSLVFAAVVWLVVPLVRGGLPLGDDGYKILSFRAQYVLGTGDAAGAMTVVETIVVEFKKPRHGIFRTLPTSYQGLETPVTNISVTRDGEPEEAQVSEHISAVDIRIGDEDHYVGTHELVVYVLTYTYGGVIRNVGDHQELYWDINGTGWDSPIDEVSARVSVPAELVPSLTGGQACYWGSFGSTDKCDIWTIPQPDAGVVIASGNSTVSAGGTQTIAIGFKAGALPVPGIAPNVKNALIAIWVIAGLVIGVAVVFMSLAAARRYAINHRTSGVHFTPDPDIPPILAAALMGNPGRGLVAELLRAANERHVKLAGGGKTGSPLTAELASWPTDWSSASKLALDSVFRQRDTGEVAEVKSRLQGLTRPRAKELLDLTVSEGLIAPSGKGIASSLLIGVSLTCILTIVIGNVAAVPGEAIIPPLVVCLMGWAILYGLHMRWQNLSEKGRSAMAYLAGLRAFLRASEAQRMRVVQGEDTSQRVGKAELIPIFEKLLPYAVALNLEDSWQSSVGATIETDRKLEWLPEAGLGAVVQELAGSGWRERRNWRTYQDDQHTSIRRWASDRQAAFVLRREESSSRRADRVGSDDGHASSFGNSGGSGGSSGGGHSGGGGGGGGGGSW